MSVTCEMKRVNALASRGCSTTVPDTFAEGDTGPSFVAPSGINGLGATTFAPVGAAAPAPAAEIVKHNNANNGAATSARKRTTRFICTPPIARHPAAPLSAAPGRQEAIAQIGQWR